MPLSFRPLFPLSVCVLLGWWWYATRRRKCLASQGGQGIAAASPRKDTRAALEKDLCSDEAKPATILEEQEDQGDASITTAAETEDDRQLPKPEEQHEEDEDGSSSSGLGTDQDTSSSANGTSFAEESSHPTQVLLASHAPDAVNGTPFLGPAKEFRPEPEGEVAESNLPVPFVENPQPAVEKELFTSEKDRDAKVCPQELSLLESETYSSTCHLTEHPPGHEPSSGPSDPERAEEDIGSERPTQRSSSPEEMVQLIEGLLEEVVRASTQKHLEADGDEGASGEAEETVDQPEEASSSMSPGRQGDGAADQRQGQMDTTHSPRELSDQDIQPDPVTTELKANCETDMGDQETGTAHEAVHPDSAFNGLGAPSSSSPAVEAEESSEPKALQTEGSAMDEDEGQEGRLSPAPQDTEVGENEYEAAHHGLVLGNGAPMSGEMQTEVLDGSGLLNDREIQEDEADCCQPTQPHTSTPTVWEIEVPTRLVGRLIGKQGKYVSFLKQRSGAKIYVSSLSYTQDFQICHMEGLRWQVEKALALIRKKFRDLDLSNRLAPPEASSPVASLPVSSWEEDVEVIVPRVEAANYLFVQQLGHPSFPALLGLERQMQLCYSRPHCPHVPAPVEAGVVCAAPWAGGGWWRAQVIQYHGDSGTVRIRYVDHGGFETVPIDSLRQIRSDFVRLPFQAAEVMLESVAPLPGEEEHSQEAKAALEELTKGTALVLRVTGNRKGLPLVQMWRPRGEQMISVNRTLVDNGLCTWMDSR